ncbi:MAG: superoxide dismutase family protein [Cyclobacteriaceae bacterium]|nr:superoxide dismutase family protein [Cyclobacteriaceae bacterium]
MKAQKVSMIAIFISLLVACTPAKKEEATDETMAEEQPAATEEVTASAVLNSASGSSVTGTANFTQTGDMMVRMSLEVQGLTPGEHALHLHEKGDCSAPDATSAGGHWNPGGMDHGKRGEGQYHAGDVINLTADENGNVSWSDEISGWTIGGDISTNILNHAVIIHDGQDDFMTQPTGAAGGRVACGVITQPSM